MKKEINVNLDRFIDICMEANDSHFDYAKSSKQYYRKHGYGVWLDRAKTSEEKHIEYAYHQSQMSDNIVSSIFEVLGFDKEQCERFYSAVRAMKRWYEKETNWERLPSDELKERIEKYVIG